MTKVIAEIGSVHDGSYGNAKELVKLASDCGADAVKFQTHIAEAETLREAKMPSFFKGEPRYDYFKRTSFSKRQWEGLIEHCDDLKIEFISSPFSEEAVDLLDKLGLQCFKIPSGEISNTPMLQKISLTKKPVILSSGMSSWLELDNAVKLFKKNQNKITLLQCTSEYPCSYKNVGINIMEEMERRYQVPVGLSDHTLTNYASFLAVSRGASVIEKHLTFSKKMYGSDAKHSLEPEEFKDLVEGIIAINKINDSPVDKNKLSLEMAEMKSVFEKSIVTLKSIKKNTILTKEMIGFKKPGTGIPAADYKKIIGRETKCNIEKNKLLKNEDLK